jgi:hypothetical protein
MQFKHVHRFILGVDVPVLRLEESIAFLEASGGSLVRWGDGESAILRGRSIPFQDWKYEHSGRLASILYKKPPRILLGIPVAALRGSICQHFKKPTWIPTRLVFSSAIQQHQIYADAFMFREEPGRALSVLKSAIKKARLLVIVSSNPLDRDYFSDLSCEIIHIPIPPKNAFSEFSKIAYQVRSLTGGSRGNSMKCKTVVLFSAGPAAKALVADLADEVRCYDVGHLFHFQRNPAKRNVWAG